MQVGQRRLAQPAETGGELGVEEVRRHRSARQFEHFEVLGGRVEHGDSRRVEHLGQRCDIYGDGIDEDHLVRPRQLQQCELGEVGALAVELGVEGVDLLTERIWMTSAKPGVVADDAGQFSVVVCRGSVSS